MSIECQIIDILTQEINFWENLVESQFTPDEKRAHNDRVFALLDILGSLSENNPNFYWDAPFYKNAPFVPLLDIVRELEIATAFHHLQKINLCSNCCKCPKCAGSLCQVK